MHERESPQPARCLTKRVLAGIAAASLASIFLPNRIAVAGGLSQAGDAFLSAAQSSFHVHAGRLPFARASLVRASTGEHATLLGAAAGFFNPELL